MPNGYSSSQNPQPKTTSQSTTTVFDLLGSIAQSLTSKNTHSGVTAIPAVNATHHNTGYYNSQTTPSTTTYQSSTTVNSGVTAIPSTQYHSSAAVNTNAYNSTTNNTYSSSQANTGYSASNQAPSTGYYRK